MSQLVLKDQLAFMAEATDIGPEDLRPVVHAIDRAITEGFLRDRRLYIWQFFEVGHRPDSRNGYRTFTNNHWSVEGLFNRHRRRWRPPMERWLSWYEESKHKEEHNA